MQTSICSDLSEISADDWNALAGDHNPFVQHAFLVALEKYHCVGDRWGWLPQHILIHENNNLVGAMPMYLKNNSYGEFVFDWAWAEAYQRHQLPYYPKLVNSIPYTPATGPRLLARTPAIKKQLVATAIERAKQLDASSMHWLFTNSDDTALLSEQGYMLREGVQFHWENNDYVHFDDFLATLTSKKRKKIKRERRLVREANVEIECLNGHEIADEQWKIFHQFYTSTFEVKSGYPTLSLDFFKALGQTMPDQVLLIMAKHENKYVAGAFNLKGKDTLYGRHWGCNQYFHSLHFECCYYAAIDYCIQHKLNRFEAGAQGEHKLARGFLPVATWSAHWLSHPQFSEAIRDFVEREQVAMDDYIETLGEHSPYKTG
ncbi:MAG: GNAT family N-acetyltransferase [Gammaproteobacteria bacterium]|nr:GNAT family N-acetyltransferase [Gammaproteobacteria bacterium]